MRIGIVCYPVVGGSGIVATELGKHLARRDHDIHLVSSDIPARLNGFNPNICFHQVGGLSYPLFQEPQYLLALTNKLVGLCRGHSLDLIHAHYAIPHATAAYLAKQVLGPAGPKIITTLHGTDITLLGSDPSFSDVVAFSIDQSDGVTAVSESLRERTFAELPVNSDIRVIHNFLDCDLHCRAEVPGLRDRLARPDEKLLIHISNFRAVKRVDLLLKVFSRIIADLPAKLLLVGEGPEWGAIQRMANEMGLSHRILFLGRQDEVVPLLSASDLFILTSVNESFGLAALEAMACGVPVLAFNVGGLSEVIDHGRDGFLCSFGNVGAMAQKAVELLSSPEQHNLLSQAAAAKVRRRFCADRIVSIYEDYYREVLDC